MLVGISDVVFKIQSMVVDQDLRCKIKNCLCSVHAYSIVATEAVVGDTDLHGGVRKARIAQKLLEQFHLLIEGEVCEDVVAEIVSMDSTDTTFDVGVQGRSSMCCRPGAMCKVYDRGHSAVHGFVQPR